MFATYVMRIPLRATFFLLFIWLHTHTHAISIAKCNKLDETAQDNVLLSSSAGPLRGSCDFVSVRTNNPKSMRSGNVYTWQGVAYAEAPVGERRFRPPVPLADKWTEPREARNRPAACLQEQKDESSQKRKNFPGFSMWNPNTGTEPSEDCLYLNLWIPAEAYLNINMEAFNLSSGSTQTPRKTAIMVFFHGSGAVSGSGSLDIYDPSAFVAATNVIVVTVNYRLGVFGSFHLTGEFDGNQGLQDQNEALRWVRRNAENFGGDVNRITVVGHGSGAVLASLHLFYRDSWPLFRNVILQSGTPLMPAMAPVSRHEANRRAAHVLALAGCGNETTIQRRNCAQNSPRVLAAATDFWRASGGANSLSAVHLRTAFVPVIDGTVLRETPEASMSKGDFKKCPVITGFNADEGSFYVARTGFLGDELTEPVHLSHKRLADFLRDYFAFYPSVPHVTPTLFLPALLHEYTKVVDAERQSQLLPQILLKDNYFATLSKLIGDESFICPAYRFADALTIANATVYVYLYAHRVSSTPWPRWYGAAHGDELAMTFAEPLAGNRHAAPGSVNPWASGQHSTAYPASEKALSLEMITYWSNFAKYNSPNRVVVQPAKLRKQWPIYKLDENSAAADLNNEVEPKEASTGNKPPSPLPIQLGKYIIFKSNGNRVNRGYSLQQCQFWNSLLPSMIVEYNQLMSKNSRNLPSVACPNQVELALSQMRNADSMAPSVDPLHRVTILGTASVTVLLRFLLH